MATKKRGLGRGLSALIPDEPKEDIEEIKRDKTINKVINIDISMIEPNVDQPRSSFENESLTELSESIVAHGMIQPIIVREIEDGYQIVAGERRWRAAIEAKLKEIPCLVRKIKQQESAEIALIENIQREDLNSIDEGIAYKKLISKYQLTQDEISKIVGKSRSYIANVTRLLKLDDRVIEYIRNNKISNGHGRTLLVIEDKEKQFNIANLIIEKKISVRDTEKLVNEIKKNRETSKATKTKRAKEPLIITIEESLRKVLGTKVDISKNKNKGKIEIEYYNEEDLERIVNLISNV